MAKTWFHGSLTRIYMRICIYIGTQEELPGNEDNYCALLAILEHHKILAHDHFYWLC